jgi:hypothetical protein
LEGPLVSTKPQPAATSFDLLDGAFAKVRRARLTQLATAGIMVIGLAAMSIQGLFIRLEASEVRQQHESQQEFLDGVRQTLATEADVGGFTRKQMEGRLTEVGVDAARAAQDDIAFREILQTVQFSTPPTVTLTGITVQRANDDEPYTVLLQATTTGYTPALMWREALRAHSLFTDFEVTWSGSEGEVTLLATGTLSRETRTARANNYIQQFTLDGKLPPKPSKDDKGDKGEDTKEGGEKDESSDTKPSRSNPDDTFSQLGD